MCLFVVILSKRIKLHAEMFAYSYERNCWRLTSAEAVLKYDIKAWETLNAVGMDEA